MQRKDENVLDKADELTSGWLIEVKARFLPSSEAYCLLNSTFLNKTWWAVHSRSCSTLFDGKYNRGFTTLLAWIRNVHKLFRQLVDKTNGTRLYGSWLFCCWMFFVAHDFEDLSCYLISGQRTERKMAKAVVLFFLLYGGVQHGRSSGYVQLVSKILESKNSEFFFRKR